MCKGYLITEQQRPEHNLLFDRIRTTLPFKHIDIALTADEEHRSDSTDIT